MIVFRQIKSPLPHGWISGLHWYVEHHDDELDLDHPTGIAFVSSFPNIGPILDFLFVVDQYRKEGVGKALLQAVKRRWPKIHITDPISEGGAALLKSVEKTHADIPS